MLSIELRKKIKIFRRMSILGIFLAIFFFAIGLILFNLMVFKVLQADVYIGVIVILIFVFEYVLTLISSIFYLVAVNEDRMITSFEKSTKIISWLSLNPFLILMSKRMIKLHIEIKEANLKNYKIINVKEIRKKMYKKMYELEEDKEQK